MEKYQIKNPLIQNAIFGATQCEHVCMPACHGYVQSDKDGYGRGILEYLASVHFNIHRFPGFEPYYFESWPYKLKEFDLLTREMIDDALHEFGVIYEHIQTELSKSDRVKNGKITLVRAVKAFEEAAIIPQYYSGKERIRIPANILTSYAHDEKLGCYDSHFCILRDVEIEKIFFFDNCILDPKGRCEDGIHGGEAEVWVLNDDLFGEIELDRSCFKVVREVNEKEKQKALSKEPPVHYPAPIYYSDRFKVDADPRPCKMGWLTKKLIERNQREIKRLYGRED